VILTQAFEYRNVPPPSSTSHAAEPCEAPEPTARYLGQVVVPGPHISKIELEEFASQTRGASSKNTSGKGSAGAEQSASASANDKVV
jgi:N-alpha-acetyltransferase 38, NatC auxiliary subunit